MKKPNGEPGFPCVATPGWSMDQNRPFLQAGCQVCSPSHKPGHKPGASFFFLLGRASEGWEKPGLFVQLKDVPPDEASGVRVRVPFCSRWQNRD